MNFPLIPALAIPEVYFLGAIFLPFLGIIISLLQHTDTKKLIVLFWSVLPIIILAIISPVAALFYVSSIAYLAGLIGGSIIFYLNFVWQFKQ